MRCESPLTCEQVAEQLAGAADGLVSLDPEARRHLATCLCCQAEAAQLRRLRRALRGLRHELSDPDPGLLDDLLSAVDSDGGRRMGRLSVHGRRVAYVGTLAAAATAAGVGGAMVLASRTRRRLPLAG
jgi:hypothetical protein